MNVNTENSPLTKIREQSSRLLKELFSKASDGNVVELELGATKGFGPMIGYLNKTYRYICAGHGIEKEYSINLDNGNVGCFYIKSYRILS